MMLFCRCSQLKCRKTRAWAAGASVRNTLDPRPQRPPTTTTDDRKTPPTIADGTRKGAAKGPAHDEPPLRGLQLPVEEPSPMRAWRLDEKPPPLASLLHQPDSSNNSLITARRSVPQTYAPFSKCSERPSLAVLQRIAARAPRAAVITARATPIADKVAAAMQRRARAPHTSPARAAATPQRALRHAKARKPTTSPTAFNRLTRQNAQALFRTKQGDHVQAETIAPHPTPRAGVPRYSLRSSAKTRTTVIRAAGSV